MNDEGIVSVFEEEIFGVCEALSWIVHETKHHKIIETDTLQTVNA